jgi:hypothetical protein
MDIPLDNELNLREVHHIDCVFKYNQRWRSIWLFSYMVRLQKKSYLKIRPPKLTQIYLFLGTTLTIREVDSTLSSSFPCLTSPYSTWPWDKTSSCEAKTRAIGCDDSILHFSVNIYLSLIMSVNKLIHLLY